MRLGAYIKNGINANYEYPEETIFAFNPNFITFSGVTGAKYVTLQCGKNKIDVEFYGGEAKADISLLLQSQFTNPRTERTKVLTVYFNFDGVGTSDMNVDFLVIWGSSSIGERLNYIGAFNFDKDRQKFVRNVRWFVNYPQKLSVYNNRRFEDFYPLKTVYEYNLDTSSVEKIALFDHTFDKTFVKNFNLNSYLDAKVYLHKDASKDGYFLRWMDNLGMYQYFLFVYGERSQKFSQKHEVTEDLRVGGYDFGGGKRMLTHERDHKYTGSAMHLTREEAMYVQTIVNSPFIDMYQGTLAGGDELWVPVVLVDGEKKVSEKKELNNFEITFIVPTSRPQQL